MQLNADNVSGREDRSAYSGDIWRHSHATMGGDGRAVIDLEAIPKRKKSESTLASISGIFGGSGSSSSSGRTGEPAAPPDDALGYEVQLASYNSRNLARRGWARLIRAAPKLLGGVGHQVKQAEINGDTVYRLRTEPMTDKKKAARLCQLLQKRNIDCLVFALY